MSLKNVYQKRRLHFTLKFSDNLIYPIKLTTTEEYKFGQFDLDNCFKFNFFVYLRSRLRVSLYPVVHSTDALSGGLSQAQTGS